MQQDVFVYRINSDDIIISVSDNWHIFAAENNWDGEHDAEEVVGHLLWGFIDGIETRQLYVELLRRVRQGNKLGPIPFRCDAPDERRFLELWLTPLADGVVEFASVLIRSEIRKHVTLLDNTAPRSDELLRICSMCKKIAVLQSGWCEIEEALAQLKIFESAKTPQLTHGLCPACYQLAMAEMDRYYGQTDKSTCGRK